MIGIGIQVQVKKSAVLTDTARIIARPLVGATQLLAGRILARVAQGRGPSGPWDTYAAGSKGPRGESLFWVAPGRPQPGTPGEGGFRFRVESGRWSGWAAYDSDRDYYRLRGLLGKPHDFSETNELLSRAVVRIVNARHVRLAFYGGHKSGLSAKQLAWLVSKDEREPLLMPSKNEVQEVQAFIADQVNAAFVEGARLSEGAQRMSSKARSVSRRASRLLGD